MSLYGSNTIDVTVVMPVYNAEPFLRESIDSILGQTFQDFELLIIEDGSTDDSKEIIEGYTDNRIRVVRHELNKGIAYSRSEAINEAKAELIAWMDADDVAVETRLEKQVKAFSEHEHLVFCASAAHRIEHGKRELSNGGNLMRDTSFRPALFFGFPFINSTVAIKKRVGQKYLADVSQYKQGEDYILYSRMLSDGQFIILPDPLLYYRVHHSDTRITHDRNNADIVHGRFIAWRTLLNYIGMNADNAELNFHDKMTYYPDRLSSDEMREVPRYLEFLNSMLVNNMNNRFYDRDSLQTEVWMRMYKTLLHPLLVKKQALSLFRKYKHLFPAIYRIKFMIKKLA